MYCTGTRSENDSLNKEKEEGEKAVETTVKLREELSKIKVNIFCLMMF